MGRREQYDPFKDESLIDGPGDDPLRDELLPGEPLPPDELVQGPPLPWQGKRAAWAGPARRKRRRYDWKLAADLLAQGQAPAAIAGRLGCAPEKLWRHMNDSSRFRALVETAIERRRLLAGIQLEAVAGAALAALAPQAGQQLSQVPDAAQLRDLASVAQAAPLTLEAPGGKAAEPAPLEARMRQAGRRTKAPITERRRARLLAEIAAMPTAEELRALARQRDTRLLPRGIAELAQEAMFAKSQEDAVHAQASAQAGDGGIASDSAK